MFPLRLKAKVHSGQEQEMSFTGGNGIVNTGHEEIFDFRNPCPLLFPLHIVGSQNDWSWEYGPASYFLLELLDSQCVSI